MNKNKKLFIFTGLFITSLLISNIIAGKLVEFWKFTVPAAVIIFPITFLITDTINEVWGKNKAKEIVWLGFYMNILMLLILQIALRLPPAEGWGNQEAFEIVFSTVPRMVVASLMAYLGSQLFDVWFFNFWKSITKGKHLWQRNNFSTLLSQLFDSVIFIGVGFIGTVPTLLLLNMILSQYIIKLLFAIIDTPFCYLTVNWAKKDFKKEAAINEYRE